MRSVTYKFDIVKNRNIYFIITAVVMLLCIGSLLVQGLNLGIDFKSGTRLDIKIDKPVDLVKSKQALEELGYKNPNARVGGTDKNILIFRINQKISSEEKDKIRDKINQTFNVKASVQEQGVDPIVGQELARNAIIAVLIASVGIILYVAFRFEYRFGIATVIAIFYDAIFTIGMFSLLQLEVDLVFVAAVLTIIGYSCNDTVVIFDRIRENMERIKPTKWEDLARVVNESINQVLIRSINTVLTVIFAAFALYVWGGESISNFALALIFGVFSGAYSSIFVASPIWIIWKWHSMKKETSTNKPHLV
jgi:preprotein translocase SecF subunit